MTDNFYYGQFLTVLLNGVETLVQFESYTSGGDIFVRLDDGSGTSFTTVPAVNVIP